MPTNEKADAIGNAKCQAATGVTVAQLPESRPETVTHLPESQCQG
jgi:hypothetical protein